ncbi:uncharacterized protein RCC_02174 [Ramularia collo-cygni]|uniref:Heterokaryon incompatibility domain-containing protein n=1 Tax=Ramularia collo-cygni TaxID=112498 RepID=A0A2D3UMC1_9PEZI|nr:uncharacterized protein RCC_02174 [Ramularia collo-cygni]CZT16332.1 uncharacterized protein RCC_02174 [Ramularia collo-cygni]
MWLLDARTMRLAKIVDEEKIHGKYAILSHTWENDDDEVNFDDIHQSYAPSMKGYKKIEYTCVQAVRDGIQYVWVDTCCIDKKSSAELSEAINSMYRWYYFAATCYAYLSDVSYTAGKSMEGDGNMSKNQSTCVSTIGQLLQSSRWFSRGWTLQELIAPKSVEFYDSNWISMSTKVKLVNHLSVITKIPTYVLEDRDRLSQTSIAQRMSWAAGRSTSRVEDQAYALLGLFGISVPLVYGGEGSKAFMRLQEMIIQTAPREDHSLLVWPSEQGRLLAPSPKAFAYGDHIVSRAHCLDETFELSNKGLRVTLLARPDMDIDCENAGESSRDNERYAEKITVALNCQYEDDDHGQLIALRLRRRPRVHTLGLHKKKYNVLGDVTYDRLTEMTTVSPEELRQFTAMTLTIARKPYSWPDIDRRISISDDSVIAYASQYVPYGKSETALNSIGGLFNLQILDSSVAFSKLIVRSLRGDWANVVLAVGMDHNETPPKLLVHAFDYGHNEGMSSRGIFRLCRVIREGEQRLLGGDSAHALRVAARYVLIGGELMWDLEIGRPEVPPGMGLARSLKEAQPGLECLGTDIASTSSLMPCMPPGSTKDGDRGERRSATQAIQPPRSEPRRLPLLNTNLHPYPSGPSLEMASPVPASSIDAEQYWKQQQFLAELYLAHVQKQEQASQRHPLQYDRRSKSVLRPSSTLKKTRLVRFMYDKMHRLFHADTSSEGLSIQSPALEDFLQSSKHPVAELGSSRTVTELPVDAVGHELHANCQPAELPALIFTRAPDSCDIYELDSTPNDSLSTTQAGATNLPGSSLTEAPWSADDVSNPIRRRFSWEQQVLQAPSAADEFTAEGTWELDAEPRENHEAMTATGLGTLMRPRAPSRFSDHPYALTPQLVSAR